MALNRLSALPDRYRDAKSDWLWRGPSFTALSYG